MGPTTEKLLPPSDTQEFFPFSQRARAASSAAALQEAPKPKTPSNEERTDEIFDSTLLSNPKRTKYQSERGGNKPVRFSFNRISEEELSKEFSQLALDAVSAESPRNKTTDNKKRLPFKTKGSISARNEQAKVIDT